jgi:hypothetical protein
LTPDDPPGVTRQSADNGPFGCRAAVVSPPAGCPATSAERRRGSLRHAPIVAASARSCFSVSLCLRGSFCSAARLNDPPSAVSSARERSTIRKRFRTAKKRRREGGTKRKASALSRTSTATRGGTWNHRFTQIHTDQRRPSIRQVSSGCICVHLWLTGLLRAFSQYRDRAEGKALVPFVLPSRLRVFAVQFFVAKPSRGRAVTPVSNPLQSVADALVSATLGGRTTRSPWPDPIGVPRRAATWVGAAEIQFAPPTLGRASGIT